MSQLYKIFGEYYYQITGWLRDEKSVGEGWNEGGERGEGERLPVAEELHIMTILPKESSSPLSLLALPLFSLSWSIQRISTPLDRKREDKEE